VLRNSWPNLKKAAVSTKDKLTIAAALSWAKNNNVDRLDAQLLLCHALQKTRTWLYAHDDTALTGAQQQQIQTLLSRRAQGEPLAYIVGYKEFYGLTLSMSRAVLIARPDTEILVDWGLYLLQKNISCCAPQVLDLGTGSGAIALALKHHYAQAQLTGVDNSLAALEVARHNGYTLGLSVHWRQSHWWQALAGERFHLVLSNPPYLAQHDPHLSALGHEPQVALVPVDDEGDDGLQAFKDITTQAIEYLHPGGWLVFEHGHTQAQAVSQLLKSNGFSEVSTRLDLAGIPRCTGGRCQF
jgi:release factor glutamine methyltransferase